MHAIARHPAVRMMEGQALAFRRLWRASVFTSVVSPVLFLAAMGLGLGSLVDHGATSRSDSLGGLGYLAFLAPGLLAASAMQTAAQESAFPVMSGIKWQRSYDAVLATPLRARDLALGQLGWAAVRTTITATAFLLALVAFGAAESPWVILALPAAVLTGTAFAGMIAGYAATVENEYGLSSLFRFGIVPLFLFSGSFFPVSQLPGWLEPVARVVPLWHGVELCRGLSTGTLGGVAALGHVAYLLAWTIGGAWFATKRFERRLVR